MKKILFYLLGIVIFILAIFFLNIVLSFFYLVTNPLFVLAFPAIMVFGLVVVGFRMKYLLIPLGERDFSVKKLIEIEFINRFIQYVLPAKLNIPAKALMLSKECNVKKTNAISVTSFEYFVHLVVLLFFVLYGMIFFKSLN